MRSGTYASFLVALCLLAALPAAAADEFEVAKVYRDYPGYINPAVCENPNVAKPAETKPAETPPPLPPVVPAQAEVQAPAAVVAPVATPVQVTPQAPASPAPSVAPAPAEVPAPAAVVAPAATPVRVAPPVQPASPAPSAGTAAQPTGATLPAAVAEPRRECAAPGWGLVDNPVNVPYVSVWAGVVATSDSDFDHDGNVSFDTGFGVGAALGYDFGPVRLELEGSHRDSSVDEVKFGNSKGRVNDDLKIDSLMVNGFVDFQTGGNLTPYLGAGIGYARVDLGNDDDSVLAGQLAAGVQIALSPQVAIDLGYRYMQTEDPKLGGSEIEVRQHTVLLGLQLRF